MSPSRLDIELLAGEEREFSLYLANSQEKDNIRVKIYTDGADSLKRLISGSGCATLGPVESPSIAA
ncbi:MAG: hypothetical protein ACE5KJ_08200 [Candidatus Zixiibacteriota bacterium]